MAEAAPSCRLYLVAPPRLEPRAFAPLLAAALDAGDVASVELALAEADDTAWRAAVAALRPVAQDRGVAFLLHGAAELAAATGCDGVRLAGPGGYAAARQVLGPDAIVGASAGTSRHAAMVAGERGADFIGLGPGADGGVDAELVAWWTELMEVPCVAFGADGPAAAAEAARAGAEFVAAGDAVWDHPDGPAAGVQALLAALAGAD